MTEELDLAGQDSDGGSEEVVLTPAELIERLEQVREPRRVGSDLRFVIYSTCASVATQKTREMEFEAYCKRIGTAS